MDKAEQLRVLDRYVEGCTKCDIAMGITKKVPGTGNPDARFMIIGEAPGQQEDLQGLPFAPPGKSGILVDKMLAGLELTRDMVFITNVLKCRPADNNTPTPTWVNNCRGFLDRQIAVIKPDVILTLGAAPISCLLRIKVAITRIRGNLRQYQGIPVVPTFHPSFILRSEGTKKEEELKAQMWSDCKKAKAILDKKNRTRQ